MIKRIFLFIVALFLVAGNANAVLKEKDLARTLGVLRAELEKDWQKQQMYMKKYEQQGVQQHEQLVNYMTQCEQIELMLYSQSTENTFDMAYACSQASALYNSLHKGTIRDIPYDRVIKNMKMEIERLEALIKSLKSMPPIIQDKTNVIETNDSILLSAIDSLGVKADSINEVEKADNSKVAKVEKKETDSGEPLVLTGEQLIDRGRCLDIAEEMLSNMYKFLDSFEAESKYYTSLQNKVSMLNDFAQSRYKVLQNNIFKIGTQNYFSLLASLPSQIEYIRSNVKDKYSSFDDKEATYSEWRGISLLFILAFVFLWLPISLLVSYVFLKWLMPKRWKGPDFKYKRLMLNNVLGIGLFGIIVTVVRLIYDKNSFSMGTGLIMNQCWLMETIFLSLYIRLKGKQMVHGALVYLPIIIMTFIVILFRIILIPNTLVRVICPPLLLIFSIWQLREAKKRSEELPAMDHVYINLTTAMMFICCATSWAGYTLLAVQILIWWTFQLAAIITISCLYNILKIVQIKLIARRVNPELVKKYHEGEKVHKEMQQLQRDMENGKYITKTWIYDLVNRSLLPILGIASILYCITSAAEVFNLKDLCYNIFVNNFLDIPNVIQLSLSKLCVVSALFFIFKWANYTTRSFYIYYRTNLFKNGQNINFTLAKNIIAILAWGLYAIISLIILKVPRSGISVITAGLATGMGFAMKDLLENFFYGISLMTGRIRVGDYIECDGVTGRVTSITYQSTMIDTLDGCVIAFLNSALFTKNFKNLTQTDDYQFVKLPVGVAYGTSIEDVRNAVCPALERDCAKNLDQYKKPRKSKKPLLDPNKKVTIRFNGFGDSSVDVWVCVWSRVEEYTWLLPHWREVIYNALNEAGIEMPFPQRDLHIKGNPFAPSQEGD